MTRILSNSPRSTEFTYLYTKGGQFSLDGQPYIGEYHLQNKQPYTGPVRTPESKPLSRLYHNADHYTYDSLFDFKVPVQQFTDPVPIVYTPSTQALSRGYDSRFFVEKIMHDSFAIEIDQNQFERIGTPGGLDPGLYGYASIKWKLVGSLSLLESHNRQQLKDASLKVPTIAYAVRSLSEFALITEEAKSPMPLVSSTYPTIQQVKQASFNLSRLS